MEADPTPARRARAFIGVGSSLAPEEHVPAALRLLRETSGVEITGISTFYRTPPLAPPGAGPEAVAGDPYFLNGVFQLHCTLSRKRLRQLLEKVEGALGRTRTGSKYAPRTLDLDLLIYEAPPSPSTPRASGSVAGPESPAGTESADGTEKSEQAAHPDIRTRPWVALPLLELAPELKLPPDAVPLRKVAQRFDGPGGKVDARLTEALRREFLLGPGRPATEAREHPDNLRNQ